jgi:hypothetical protein
MAEHNDFDRERDWDRDRDRERGMNRGEWSPSRTSYGRGDYERENRERWSGAQDWDRERRNERWGNEPSGREPYGREDYRRNQPWAGERQGEFRAQGDWGRQGSWGTYGNRGETNREDEWGRRQSGVSQWGGGAGQYGQGTGRWGGYSGGMGSYGGGMGQERGRFSGRGPKGYQRSDERIREDVNERLTDHPDIDASEIEVQVREGEVTLTGTVEDRQTKRRAEDVAESVSGVKEIHNQLRIQQHAMQGQGQQETLQAGQRGGKRS